MCRVFFRQYPALGVVGEDRQTGPGPPGHAPDQADHQGRRTGRCSPRGSVDASYNSAKIPLDFTVSIARIRLKGRYGEGFGGAPLRTCSPRPEQAIGDGGERHEQAAAQGSTSAGGDGHV